DGSPLDQLADWAAQASQPLAHTGPPDRIIAEGTGLGSVPRRHREFASRKTELPGPTNSRPGQRKECGDYSAGAGFVVGPRSANAPRMARRSTSAKPASAAGSGLSSETTIPDRNDNVMVMRQGFFSGKYHHCLETSAKSFLRMSTWIVGPQ